MANDDCGFIWAGAGRNIGSPRRELGLGVLVFTFRMLLSVQSEAGARLSMCQLQAEAVGASQVASVL